MAHKYEHVSTGGGFSVKNGSTKTEVISQAGVLNQATIATGAIATAKLADASISAVKAVSSQAVTGTDDGLTTGLITSPTTLKKFVTVTSAGATKAVTLPAASAANLGCEIYLTVGANGYELLTPASGNNTINAVDSDGTNQLDVAANTTLRCTQITATGWLAEQIAATAITVVAPDND